MDWHQGREEDLLECLELEPRHIGDEILGRARALTVWKGLLHSRSFTSVVIDDSSLGPSRQILGFGSSVFVTAAFAARELERPRMGLNSRILASVADEEGSGSAVLAEDRLCPPGSSDAVDVVILSGNYRRKALSEEQILQAQMLLAFTFMEQHVGYRLNRILMETTSEAQRLFHESSGVWRTVERYADDRALIVLSRQEAFAVSGSVAAPLFQYREPVLQLRDTEKELLSEALQGETDSELAARMNLSVSTVKKRWGTLFDRVAELRPELIPDGDGGAWKDSRGPQKRHRILAYVRTRPQELRPFRWRSLH